MDRYFVALHGKEQRVGYTAAHDGEVDFGVLGTAQTLHDVFGAHLYAGNGGVVHGGDAVAGQDAHFFRRSSAYGLDDEQRVFNHLELDADALEVALQGFVHGLHLFGVVVGGVGVEVFQHAGNGVFHQAAFVHGVHVEAADGKFGHLELAQLDVVDSLCPGTRGAEAEQ